MLAKKTIGQVHRFIGEVPDELRIQGVETVISETVRDYRILVSPTLAEWFIEIGHPNQRSRPPSEIAYVRGLMERGAFVEYCMPGIYCDRRGKECNGQTRLSAQVQSGLTLGWMLRIGASDEEIAALDSGRVRRAHQTLGLLGEGMTAREQSVYRMYERLLISSDIISAVQTKMGPEKLRELRKEFGLDVDWAVKEWGDKLAPASMVAALAYMRPVMPDTIASFAQAYANARLGMGSGRLGPQSPPVVLARYMNSTKLGAGGVISVELANRALSAGKAFCEGRDIAKLYGERETAKPLRYFKAVRLAGGLSG